MTHKNIIKNLLFLSMLFLQSHTYCMQSLVELLLRKPTWRDQNLKFNPRDKHFNTIASLLEKGIDVEEHKNYVITPLKAAIFNEHAKTFELLLQHSVDVNNRDHRTKETPLQIAFEDCPNMNLFAITLLLERNAKIFFKNNNNKKTDLQRIKEYSCVKEDFLDLFIMLESIEFSVFKDLSEGNSKHDFDTFCFYVNDCLKYKYQNLAGAGGCYFGKGKYKTPRYNEFGREIETGISKDYIYLRILIARMLFALTSKKEFNLFKECLNQKFDGKFLETNMPDYKFLYEHDQKIHRQVNIHLLKHFLDHGIVTWNNDMFSILPSKKLRQNMHSDYMPTCIYESAILMKTITDINFYFKK